MAAPLEGIRVVDLSQVISGPWATVLLADQGAEVIKVEPTSGGEVLRPFTHFARGGINALIANNNRGKLGLAVDLGSERGVDTLRRVIDTADVFVQNFRPGVAERLGLDADALRDRNPRLVTCSITGFGPDGPWAQRPVYDPIIQAMSGHVAIQVNPEIPFPDLVRNTVCDKATALMAAQAITAALFARERNGEGQHVEIAMLDAAISFLWPDGMMSTTVVPGDGWPDAPAGPTMAGRLPAHRVRRRAPRVLGGPSGRHLEPGPGARPPRVGARRALGRQRHTDAPGELGGARAPPSAKGSANCTVAEAIQRLQEHDVPVGPVLSLEEVPRHEQVAHNGIVVEWVHPTAGPMRQAGPAAHFSDTPASAALGVPLLGEHTDQVLRASGFADDEIAALRADGVIA